MGVTVCYYREDRSGKRILFDCNVKTMAGVTLMYVTDWQRMMFADCEMYVKGFGSGAVVRRCSCLESGSERMFVVGFCGDHIYVTVGGENYYCESIERMNLMVVVASDWELQRKADGLAEVSLCRR
jgi:hypothetical protein